MRFNAKRPRQASLSYDEKTLQYAPTDAGPFRSIRCYQKASDAIQAEGGSEHTRWATKGR